MATPPPAATTSTLALTLPVAMGYVPLGTVFGFLFVQAGGAWWLALGTSVWVYAGASQYMMIPMVAAGVSTLSIAVATVVINLRHAFYGLSLLHRLPLVRWQRWYLVFALTDETYSVLTTLPPHTSGQRMVWIAALNQFWWLLGTLLGAVLGAQAKLKWIGLDFALVALFAVLTVEQWRARRTGTPLWTALLAFALARLLLPQHALPVAIAACVVVGWLWAGRVPLRAERGKHD